MHLVNYLVNKRLLPSVQLERGKIVQAASPDAIRLSNSDTSESWYRTATPILTYGTPVPLQR